SPWLRPRWPRWPSRWRADLRLAPRWSSLPPPGGLPRRAGGRHAGRPGAPTPRAHRSRWASRTWGWGTCRPGASGAPLGHVGARGPALDLDGEMPDRMGAGAPDLRRDRHVPLVVIPDDQRADRHALQGPALPGHRDAHLGRLGLDMAED